MLQLKVEDDGFKFTGRSYNYTSEKNELLAPYNKMLNHYGVVLELLPEGKESDINQQIGNARFIRNTYLNDCIKHYKETGKHLTVNEYKKTYIPKLKEKYEFLKSTDKFAIESALSHIDVAYKNFFEKRAGFPRFLSKTDKDGNSYTTKSTNNNIRLSTDSSGRSYIRLPKLGDIRVVMPIGKTVNTIVPDGTRILSATVRYWGGKYTVSLCMESIIDIPQMAKMITKSDIIATDLGLKIFGAFGNEDVSFEVKNPKWIEKHEKRLKRYQRSLARKYYDKTTKTGSNNRAKLKSKIQKEHRKIANQRKDLHHKLSRYIADNYKAFICEDLNIKGMLKNRHLAKAISSVGWRQFLTFVEYKIKAKGGYFIKIDRWTPTSQTCHVCGHKNKDIKDLSVRAWRCPVCGTMHDRDMNAMLNILNEGVNRLNDMGIAVA